MENIKQEIQSFFTSHPVSAPCVTISLMLFNGWYWCNIEKGMFYYYFIFFILSFLQSCALRLLNTWVLIYWLMWKDMHVSHLQNIPGIYYKVSCRTVCTALQENRVDMTAQIFSQSYSSAAITKYEYVLLLFQLTTYMLLTL